MHSEPFNLSPVDKLEVIQRLDCFHPWESLDEKRYCRRCGEVITGEQIQVFGSAKKSGPMRLQCPTEGCCSVPIEWIISDSQTEAVRAEAAAVSGNGIWISDRPIVSR